VGGSGLDPGSLGSHGPPRMLLGCEVLGGERGALSSTPTLRFYPSCLWRGQVRWLSQDGFEQVERFPFVLWGIIQTL